MRTQINQARASIPVQGALIAIVGRPNVGKSTLFNRLIGARKAVVSSIRGTTRDRLYGHTEWRGIPLTLIDTGGREFGKATGLNQQVQRHIARAIQDAHRIVLVCDGQEGLVPADEMILERLRIAGKPVILAVNKVDHHPRVPPDFFTVGGVDATVAISALHGRGVGDLLDHLVVGLIPAAGMPRQPSGPAIAIIGRQNVGKSSLLNVLLREERVIVSEQPGTTRDAIDTRMLINGDHVTLIDTAGLRHKRKVRSPVDLFAMARSLDAIQRCDVAMMVLDATQGVTSDDRRLATQVSAAGCGLVVLINKWDLARKGDERALSQVMRRSLPSASFAPVLAVSAKTGFRVRQSLETALQVFRAMRRGLAQEELSSLLEQAWAKRQVPRLRGRAIRLLSARWIAGRPMRIELETSPGGQLPLPYQRYLLHVLQAHPKLTGVSLRLSFPEPAHRRLKR